MLVCLLLMASISYAQSETIVVGKKSGRNGLKSTVLHFSAAGGNFLHE